MGQRGFTLLELIVVLAILALTTTLVLPLLSGGRDRTEFRATLREITLALRQAQSTAITRDRPQILVVDVEHGLFRIGDSGRPYRIPKGIRLSLLTTTRERLDRGVGDIRFFPDGSSTGGHISVIQGERQSDVSVEWLSGRVSVSETASPPRQ